MDASGPQPSAPDKLERITAEQLTGSPGFAVSPIQVRVIDSHGAGVRGQAVTFTVVSGGGSISPPSTSTDSAGVATATWTLGPVAGNNVARADAGKLGSVTFTASAAESPGVIITALSGSSTTTIPGGCALPDPVMVKVTDASGKPVPNAVVEFDPDKSGSANPAVANTDAQGIAKTVWTAGLDGGANTLRAVLRNSARPSVTFTATSTPRAPNGFSVVGNKILDAQCKPIVLHGIARPSLQWNAGGDDRFNVNAAEDFALIKSWKANVVRIAVTQVFWLAGNKQYDATYKQRVIDTVNKARAAGLAVILDLHASDRGNPNYSTVPDVQQLPDAAHSIPFWKDAAATFKNDGGVIFELYNEPHDITWEQWRNGGFIAAGPSYVGDPSSREAYQGVGMQQVLDAVRSVGANNLVIVSGLHWGYFLDELPKYALTGSNIVYATHPYDWPDKQPDAWEEAWGKVTSQFPVMVTEFGAYECSRLSYYQSVLDYADKKGLGWVAWAWWTPPPVSSSYTSQQRESDICLFPALIRDWNGTPSVSGQLIKNKLASY